jgi:hypothetical protein
MGLLERHEMRHSLEKIMARLAGKTWSATAAADTIMGLIDQRKWSWEGDRPEEEPRVAQKMYPLIRLDNGHFHAGSPGHSGYELKQGDTVDVIIGGEFVRGELQVVGVGEPEIALQLKLELDLISLENMLEAGQTVQGGETYELPLPDCVLLRKVG